MRPRVRVFQVLRHPILIPFQHLNSTTDITILFQSTMFPTSRFAPNGPTSKVARCYPSASNMSVCIVGQAESFRVFFSRWSHRHYNLTNLTVRVARCTPRILNFNVFIKLVGPDDCSSWLFAVSKRIHFSFTTSSRTSFQTSLHTLLSLRHESLLLSTLRLYI